ncbi:hypothetical protein NDU88_003178 [Pleurodeles waltl]|uniref:Mitochondrial fission factor n=2 Tax=Pleurodeles waltl TaxID=8319 RepID=A0AAV7VEM9_PLEWA|nr:hypothetical protein NDU88_003178 [Pleurodeles waltl]
MHIPERISLAGVEMMEVSLMPFHWEQVKQKPSITLASQGYATQSGLSTKRSMKRVQELNNCSEKSSSDTQGSNHGHDGSPSTEEIGVCRLETSEKSPPLLLPSPQDTGTNASSRPVEDLGLMEIVAMRNQLIKISRRLQNLEEERAGGYQKELLMYFALLTACILNTLLWLRK